MFEKTRQDLVKRLRHLMDRFEKNRERAFGFADEADFAARSGLSEFSSSELYYEIANKSIEQAMLCGEALEILIIQRAFPFTFKKGVRKAEAFADQCEAILDSHEHAKNLGRAQFRRTFGEENNAPNN